MMKLLTHLYTLFIVFSLVACGNNKTDKHARDEALEHGTQFEKQQENQKNASETNSENSCFSQTGDSLLKIKDTVIIAGGVVQTSGLQEYDKLEVDANYQLVSPKKSFYLVTEKDLSAFWGKCVSVKGTLAEGWDLNSMHFNGNPTFGRTALHITSVSLAGNEMCNSYLPLIDPPRNVKRAPIDTLQGVIVRTRRPAPDIGYDYGLQLSESISHPEEPTLKLNQITIHLDIPLEKRNELIENQTTIKTIGRITGGYAETYVFFAEEIEDISG